MKCVVVALLHFSSCLFIYFASSTWYLNIPSTTTHQPCGSMEQRIKTKNSSPVVSADVPTTTNADDNSNVCLCMCALDQTTSRTSPIYTYVTHFLFFIVCCSPSVHRPSIFKMDAFVTATTPAFVYWPFYLFCFVCFRPLHLYIYLKRHIKNKEKEKRWEEVNKTNGRQGN